MMHPLAQPVTDLIEAFSQLPGIGPKSASRLAYFLLRSDSSIAINLATALQELKEKTLFCDSCHNIADRNPCSVCADIQRDRSTICVVEEPLDVQAIERTREYRGLYHVLHGAISPVDGIGPEDLKVSELLQRIQQASSPSTTPSTIMAKRDDPFAAASGQPPEGQSGGQPDGQPSEIDPLDSAPVEIKEIVLATNPSLEGDATAMYISRLIKPLGIRVTRLARGLPVGGDLEYADEVTLGRALEGRSEM